MPTFLFLDFLAENMAINSTYSVYKSSRLPLREQKSTWHFLGYYFICKYSYASKILVTKEELITEALNDSHDYYLSWQNISRHRRNLLLEMCMGGLFSFFMVVVHLLVLIPVSSDKCQGHKNRRPTVLREKIGPQKIQWHVKNILCFMCFAVQHYPLSVKKKTNSCLWRYNLYTIKYTPFKCTV